MAAMAIGEPRRRVWALSSAVFAAAYEHNTLLIRDDLIPSSTGHAWVSSNFGDDMVLARSKVPFLLSVAATESLDSQIFTQIPPY